jgi:serine/threonine protein phosphatase PrpC
MSSKVEVAVRSDMGCVRKNNEDNFGYDPAHGIYVVCDGMGGVAAGEVASAIACSTTISTFVAQPDETPAHTRLALAIHSANSAVRHAAKDDNQHGMGTTLVCAVVQGNKLLVGNVGDSRAYLFKNGATMQLTVDHSYINELVRQGAVRVEDIHTVNLKGMESVITRAIGAAHDVEPDFFALDLKPNDALLLASDGLTRYVDSGLLVDLVDPTDLDSSCERLIDAAKTAGGADNITCLLLRYDEVADASVGAPAVGISFVDEPVEAEPVHATHIEEPVAEAPLIPVHVIEDLEFESPISAFVDEAPSEIAPAPAAKLIADEPAYATAPAGTLANEDAPALPLAWLAEAEAPKHSASVSFEDLLDGDTKH